MSVVISGATGGIGLSIVRKYASQGYDLILLGRDKDKLDKLCIKTQSNYNITVKYFICDMKNESTIHSSIKKISKLSEDVILLINIAGIFPYGLISESTEEQYDNCMNVNMKLPYLLSLGLFDKIKKGSGGKIINIGSSSAYSGFKNTVIYCASKHALLGFSRALNDEWKDYGVSVHCISPGTIDTEMASVLEQDKNTYIKTEEFAELVYDVSTYNGNMLVEEVRAVRRCIR
jgi:3-oxoacyl-[acyl-carrier protein] reductase